jgi:site-specific recombinase XerD
LLKEFLNYLDFEKNYSKLTIKEYAYDLLLFQKFVKIDLLFAGSSEIRSFLAHLKRDKNDTANTLRRKLAVLRSFYKFCIKQKKIAVNPVEEIESPKLPQRKVIYLTDQEKFVLFQVAKNKTYKIEGKRNYAIVILLYCTGLRVSELVNLTFSSIVPDGLEYVVKVIGKGDKERHIPLNNEAKNVLDVWLKNRPAGESNAIFVANGKKKKMTTRNVQYIIQNLAKEAGIQKNITPHKLRHTFGTNLLLKGANLVNIQALLGHVNLNTTQIYLHTNKESLAQDIKKLSL